MDNISIYCASSDERILRFDPISNKEELSLLSLKGASDSGQIIILTNIKTKVTLETNDLIDEKGNVLTKECFKIYFEKYIYVDKNWQKNGYKIGYYPDALINEDIVKSENETGDGNVAIWIDLNVDINQEPGIYKGTFNLEGLDKTIKVSVNVLDASIDKKITHKSIFTLNGEHLLHYEGEVSKEIVEAYNNVLLEHRVTSAIPASSIEEEWEEDVLKHILSGHSTINIPSVPSKHELYGNVPDYDDLMNRLIIVAI